MALGSFIIIILVIVVELAERVGGLFIKFAIIPRRVDIAAHEMLRYKPGGGLQ